jgi:hypothetical protein
LHVRVWQAGAWWLEEGATRHGMMPAGEGRQLCQIFTAAAAVGGVLAGCVLFVPVGVVACVCASLPCLERGLGFLLVD